MVTVIRCTAHPPTLLHMANLTPPTKTTDSMIRSAIGWIHLGQAILLKLPRVTTTGHQISLQYEITMIVVMVNPFHQPHMIPTVGPIISMKGIPTIIGPILSMKGTTDLLPNIEDNTPRRDTTVRDSNKMVETCISILIT